MIRHNRATAKTGLPLCDRALIRVYCFAVEMPANIDEDAMGTIKGIVSAPSEASLQRTKARPGAGHSFWVQEICNLFSFPQSLVSRLGSVGIKGLCKL